MTKREVFLLEVLVGKKGKWEDKNIFFMELVWEVYQIEHGKSFKFDGTICTVDNPDYTVHILKTTSRLDFFF